MNPFLAKPLRKVQPGQNLKNTSAEHRPSRYLAANVRNSKIVVVGGDKKPVDPKKIKNPSPSNKNAKNVNNINLIKSNKEEEKTDNSQIEINKENKENIEENKENKDNKENKENVNNAENNAKIFTNDLKIENNINFTYPKSSEGLVFQNNDEILDYIKMQIKEGKIKNVLTKLEMKKSEFTGYTLCKKNQGFTIYEIEIEEDIDKINESIKKQKVEINKKPVELRFASSNEQPVSSAKKETKETNKETTQKDKKITVPENKKQANLIHAMKNKTMEKQIENIKNDKMTNEIKNLQNRVRMQKQELRNAENEADIIRKEAEKKKAINASKVNFNVPTEGDDKKKRSIEENEKKISKALERFKKAYSKNEDKDKDKDKSTDEPPKDSNKIKTLASILQEHIIKPLAEIQQENYGMATRARGGSVDNRVVRHHNEVVGGMTEILQNAPIQKKNVKKPKIIAFE
jgi:hypothetical protein